MEIATLEAVRTAAETLAQKKPADEIKAPEIRQMIGGGSYTTINRRLSEWRAARESEELFRTMVPDMPDEVRGLWERVWHLADAQHQDTRDVWSAEKQKLLQDIRERDAEIMRLEGEAEKAGAALDALNRDLEEARQAVSAAQKERDLAVARAEATEATLARLFSDNQTDRQQEMIDSLAARLETHFATQSPAPEAPSQAIASSGS